LRFLRGIIALLLFLTSTVPIPFQVGFWRPTSVRALCRQVPVKKELEFSWEVEMTGKNIPNLCRVLVVASTSDLYFPDNVAALSLQVASEVIIIWISDRTSKS
jgi:hypothetical protein